MKKTASGYITAKLFCFLRPKPTHLIHSHTHTRLRMNEHLMTCSHVTSPSLVLSVQARCSFRISSLLPAVCQWCFGLHSRRPLSLATISLFLGNCPSLSNHVVWVGAVNYKCYCQGNRHIVWSEPTVTPCVPGWPQFSHNIFLNRVRREIVFSP